MIFKILVQRYRNKMSILEAKELELKSIFKMIVVKFVSTYNLIEFFVPKKETKINRFKLI